MTFDPPGPEKGGTHPFPPLSAYIPGTGRRQGRLHGLHGGALRPPRVRCKRARTHTHTHRHPPKSGVAFLRGSEATSQKKSSCTCKRRTRNPTGKSVVRPPKIGVHNFFFFFALLILKKFGTLAIRCLCNPAPRLGIFSLLPLCFSGTADSPQARTHPLQEFPRTPRTPRTLQILGGGHLQLDLFCTHAFLARKEAPLIGNSSTWPLGFFLGGGTLPAHGVVLTRGYLCCCLTATGPTYPPTDRPTSCPFVSAA